MSLFNKEKGQGAAECLLGLTLLVVVTVSLKDILLPAENTQTMYLKLSRQVTWEKLRDLENTKLSGSYRLNDDLGRVFGPIDSLLPVNLVSENLRVTDPTKIPIFNMVRLTDSWEARSESDLTSRPASLVVNNVLSGDVTEIIQDGLGTIFLEEELESDSLIFGHIDPNVVPESALLER